MLFEISPAHHMSAAKKNRGCFLDGGPTEQMGASAVPPSSRWPLFRYSTSTRQMSVDIISRSQFQNLVIMLDWVMTEHIPFSA